MKCPQTLLLLPLGWVTLDVRTTHLPLRFDVEWRLGGEKGVACWNGRGKGCGWVGSGFVDVWLFLLFSLSRRCICSL